MTGLEGEPNQFATVAFGAIFLFLFRDRIQHRRHQMQHDHHAGGRPKRMVVGISESSLPIAVLFAFCAITIALSMLSLPQTNATATIAIANTNKETEEPPFPSRSNTRIGKGNVEDDDNNRGLRYQLYDNAVLSGSHPLYEGTTISASLSLEPPPREAQPPKLVDPQERMHSLPSDSRSLSSPLILSGALKGSLSVAEVGRDRNQQPLDHYQNNQKKQTPRDSRNYWYVFDCVFDGTATGWARVGSHLVCHDGNAYQHQHQDPTPLLPNKRYAFHAILTSNVTNATTLTTSGKNNTNNNNNTKQVVPSLSVYWKMFLPPAGGRASEATATTSNTSQNYGMDGSDHHPLDRGFRLLSILSSPLPTSIPSLEENRFFGRDDQEDLVVVLHPTLPPHEAKLEDLQNKVSKGWGQWLVPDLLSFTNLPEGIVMGLQICGRQATTTNSGGGTKNHRNCVGPVVPDSAGTIRVDRHSTDRSYASFNLTFDDPSKQHDSKNNKDSSSEPSGSISLTMESSVTGSDHEELRYLITITGCDSCEGFVLEVVPRYAWFRPGWVSKTTDTSLTFSTPGLGDIYVRVLLEEDYEARWDGTEKESLSNTSTTLRIPLSRKGQKIGVIAGPHSSLRSSDDDNNNSKISLAELEKHIRVMDKLEASRMERTFGPKHEVAHAIQAAVMWSWIYNPIEGGPFLPVSRSPQWAETFASKAGAANPDWNYVIFEWDNLFASLMAGLFDKDIAYSNLFVSVRSRTPDGFLPNWSTAGGIRRSGDRTEPPIGARILLELYRKYKDTWIVEALWEDLVEWNDWFMRERLLEPLGLIGLRSYGGSDHAADDDDDNNLQAARYESGLDNSPMYDGDESHLYDKTTHRMQMYDVGMSSLVAHEAYCLVELADAINIDPDKARLLRSRADRLRDNIWKYLWDPTRNIFANRYRQFLPGTNSSFVRSITPTSFYPLLLPFPEGNVSLGGANGWSSPDALDATIESMVGSWLLNATRFCLSPNGEFEGKDPNDACYWGLPSVSADDLAYMATGHWNYWRGRVWGPMAQIVYWSLHEKDRRSNQKLSSSSSSSPSSPSVLLHDNSHQLADTNFIRRQRKTSSSSKAFSSNTTKARKSLCSQMEALMMSQWKRNRHICENYSPYKNATECSGTLFYHWGALNGMIGMIEDGYYYSEIMS